MAQNSKALAAAVTILLKKNPHRLVRETALERLFDDHSFVDEYEDVAEDIVDEALGLARQQTAGPSPAVTSRPMQPPRPSGQDRKTTGPAPSPSAPFRFVALQDGITPPEGEHRLDVPVAGGFCATIEVDWVAETPLLIGSGADKEGVPVKPMQLPDGKGYVIPGASLRGLLLSCT